MSDYQFTQDWFHWAPQVWKQLIPLLPEGETFGAADHGVRSFLEIGSFEGRSMAWIAENMMRAGDELVCIDTWEGGEEHGAENMSDVEKRFDYNRSLALTGRDISIIKYKGTSIHWMAHAIKEAEAFDFIYIDGSHVAKDVMTDACMAWPLLKKGGILVFDDYMWGEPVAITHKPKLAIDCFTTLFGEELDIIHLGYQLIVRKR